MAPSRMLSAAIVLTAVLTGSSLLAQEKTKPPGPGESRPAQGKREPPKKGWRRPDGYRPLRRPTEPATPDRAPRFPGARERKKEKPPKGLFQARFYYRYSFLNGTDIGKDQGFFLGDPPTADEAFRNSHGAGFVIERWITPSLAIHTSISYQRLKGRTVTTPVDRVSFDDLDLLKISIGPRLSWPVTIDSNRWGDATAVAEMEGMIPYARLGFGWAVSSSVDVRLQNGQKVDFWSQGGSFHFVFAIGFEYRWHDLGAYLEFGVDTFGPLNDQTSEAKSFAGTEFPFILGVNLRF